MADPIPFLGPEVIIRALRRAPGTREVVLGGRTVRVSDDPEVERRARAALAALDSDDAADSARRAAGLGISPEAYASLGPVNR